MTDNPAPYRSTMAVPERVDRAWQRGYDAGSQRWKHVAAVELVGGLWLALRRGRMPVVLQLAALYGLALLVLLAVCIAPLVGVYLVARAVYRRRPPTPPSRVRLDDGSLF